MLPVRQWPFEWYVSFRYFTSRKRQGFLSIITGISILGVAVGVMALIVVLAVMNGFQHDLRERILGVSAHITIRTFYGTLKSYEPLVKELASFEDVEAVSPYIYLQGLITSGNKSTGALIRGLDLPGGGESPIAKNIVVGSIEKLKDSSIEGEMPSIVLGIELARQLDVHTGDLVTLLIPTGRVTPVGQLPKSKAYKVAGLFQSGMYEYDHTFAYISLKESQRLLGIPEQVMGIELWLRDPEKAPLLVEQLQAKMANSYWIRDWMQMNKNLFSALKLEKVAMFIILTLIVFVAAFNIVSSLIMLVLDKSRDIAILKAMGATGFKIRRVFMLVGLFIGSSGTIIGLIGGFLLCAVLKRYHFIELPRDIYYISTLPVRVEWGDVAIICIAAVAISFIATIYPAKQAASLDPIEALRYE